MAEISWKPINDLVLVEPLPEHERGTTTKSGIFIPDTVEKERAEQGTVVAVGPGKLNDKGERTPLSVNVGDKVIFTKYGPDEVKIDDKDYFVLSESAIRLVQAQ